MVTGRTPWVGGSGFAGWVRISARIPLPRGPGLGSAVDLCRRPASTTWLTRTEQECSAGGDGPGCGVLLAGAFGMPTVNCSVETAQPRARRARGGRLPECRIPPGRILQYRALLETYHDLRAERTSQVARASCLLPGRPRRARRRCAEQPFVCRANTLASHLTSRAYRAIGSTSGLILGSGAVTCRNRGNGDGLTAGLALDDLEAAFRSVSRARMCTARRRPCRHRACRWPRPARSAANCRASNSTASHPSGRRGHRRPRSRR